MQIYNFLLVISKDLCLTKLATNLAIDHIYTHMCGKIAVMWTSYLYNGNLHTSKDYRKICNIRRTKSQNLSDCRLVLQLPLANPLKPGVKLTLKM